MKDVSNKLKYIRIRLQITYIKFQLHTVWGLIYTEGYNSAEVQEEINYLDRCLEYKKQSLGRL